MAIGLTGLLKELYMPYIQADLNSKTPLWEYFNDPWQDLWVDDNPEPTPRWGGSVYFDFGGIAIGPAPHKPDSFKSVAFKGIPLQYDQHGYENNETQLFWAGLVARQQQAQQDTLGLQQQAAQRDAFGRYIRGTQYAMYQEGNWNTAQPMQQARPYDQEE